LTSIKLPPTKVLLFLFVLISLIHPAAAEQDNQEAPKAPSKPRRVFTNDDIKDAGSQSGDGLPQIPGLIRCASDLKCFLQALDSATPAAVTRAETVEQGTAVVTSNSIWWTTQYTGEQCLVSFRIDAFEAKVNEKVVGANPKASRDAAEGKLAEMNREFEGIRGKVSTCTMAVKDLKALMTASAWSLMSLGPASRFGRNCSGAAFDRPSAPLSNEKK
jgi:hypothetical protein